MLGRSGAGKKTAICKILGLQDYQQDTDDDAVQECSKHRGEVAGRQVTITDEYGRVWTVVLYKFTCLFLKSACLFCAFETL